MVGDVFGNFKFGGWPVTHDTHGGDATGGGIRFKDVNETREELLCY